MCYCFKYCKRFVEFCAVTSEIMDCSEIAENKSILFTSCSFEGNVSKLRGRYVQNNELINSVFTLINKCGPSRGPDSVKVGTSTVSTRNNLTSPHSCFARSITRCGKPKKFVNDVINSVFILLCFPVVLSNDTNVRVVC